MPWWMQWTVVLAVVAIGGWLVVTARMERQSRAAESPNDTVEAAASASPSTSGRPRLVKTSVPVARTQTRVRVTERARGFNPMQLFVTVFGFAAGWVAIDRVRAVDTMGNFIRTDGAAQVAQLAFAFAALLWVGGALAPVAPRGAIAILLIAGAIGTFLSVPDRWEVRLEWWGAQGVLNAWSSRPLWAGGAFCLALLTLIAERFRPGR
jgi:hypothetical protein